MVTDSPTPALGQQFKDARTIRHWSLEDVEVETKIRLRHLQAIEEARYEELPPDVFAVGFVRRYARALGLNPEAAAYLFRQERAARRPQKKRALGFSPPYALPRPRFVVSSRAIISLVLTLVVLLLFGYIWYQVRLFASPPPLTISAPIQDSVVATERVTVEGQTSPSATLFINSEAVPLDEQGTFRQDVRLTPGVNTIEFKAVNRLGKETVEIVHILYRTTEIIEIP